MQNSINDLQMRNCCIINILLDFTWFPILLDYFGNLDVFCYPFVGLKKNIGVL